MNGCGYDDGGGYDGSGGLFKKCVSLFLLTLLLTLSLTVSLSSNM